MSIDYELAGWFPFDDPGAEAVRVAAGVLGAPAGTTRIEQDGLVVHAVPPDDDDELDTMRRYLGFDANLTLVFALYGRDDQLNRAQVDMLRCAAELGRRGVRALLFADYGADDSVILRIEGGEVTLNEAWTDWRDDDPDVAAAIRQPYTKERLGFAHRA
jgi:hypothetical protein